MNRLRKFAKDRSLVSIHRPAIDKNKIQGFVLDSSDGLVLLQYVYDFSLDGLMVLRADDISEVTRTKTDLFQEQLLADEGLLSRVPFDYRVNLTSWKTAISGLVQSHSLLILECERIEEPEFVVGRIAKIGANEVSVNHFTGTGRWLDELVTLRYDDITACQANTNYVNVYQRYFERHGR